MAQPSPKIDEILSYFGANVRELLAAIEPSPPRHVGVSDLIELDDDITLEGLLGGLRDIGFDEHFTLPWNYFTAEMDRTAFRLCCDGTREFEDDWTSFVCRREKAVVFAFKNGHDAVLARMHT